MAPDTMRRLAGAIALATLGFPGAALAADPPAGPIVLRWTAPSGCPTEAEVGVEIERALGGAPDPASPRHLQAEATASRAGKEGFRVHLVTDMGGAIGERDFSGPTCLAVARAAALIVALTFDPEAVARQSADSAETNAAPASSPPPAGTPPPASTTPPVTPPPALPAPSPGPSHEPSPGPSREPSPGPSREPVAPPRGSSAPPVRSPVMERASASPRLVVGLLAQLSAGALPGIGIGVGGRAGLLFERFSVDLAASYWPDRTATAAAKAGAGGHVRMVAGDARACYAFPLARLALGPCAGIELGRVSADGFGVRRPGSGAAVWVAPLLEATAALSLHPRFALRLDLGALAPIERPTFVLERVGSVFRASPVAGRASLGAEVRF